MTEEDRDRSDRHDLRIEVALIKQQVGDIKEDVKQVRLDQREAKTTAEGALDRMASALRSEQRDSNDKLEKKVTWVQVTMVGLLTGVTGTALLVTFDLLTR